MIEEIKKLLNEYESEIIETRRSLHKIPELEFEENETADFICKRLDEMGVSYERGIAKTGIKADIVGEIEDSNAKCVLLRADMDALPIEEKTDVSYRSCHSGKMHACGHDGHIAILLAVIYALNKNKDKFSGRIVAVFQPAEEGDGGAKPMIESGAFESYNIDYAFGVHVEPTYNTGIIALKDGPLMASPDEFEIEVVGKGGHGAYREKCIDPIYAASELALKIIDVAKNHSSENSPCVVSVGALNGGVFYNVIPDSVKLKGTARAVDFEKRNILYNEIKRINDEVCKKHNTTSNFEFRFMYPPLVNNKSAVDFMRGAVCDIGLELLELEKPFMGGEDFAYFAEKYPSAFVYVGCRNEEKDCIYPWHSSKFNMDEACLVNGAKLLCAAVIRVFENKLERD